MKPVSAGKLSLLVATGLMYLSCSASAQESAYEDLNACVSGEQKMLTLKGAGAGALAGLTAGLFTKKKEDALIGAAVGAAAGGIAGFATAYYTAIDTCRKKNPNWIPESTIERTKSFKQVKAEMKYKPTEGIRTKVRKVEMPATASAGSTVDVTSTFVVMTPDGAETPVVVERKLFVINDGKETALAFPQKNPDERTVEAGENKDVTRLTIAPETKPGTAYRVEFGVASGTSQPSTVSSTISVI